jgi:hypothetical protein
MMPDLDLDHWLPDPIVCSRHSRPSSAAPDVLWTAATSVRLDDTGTLGRLVRWRIPETPGSLTFRELFARYPFTVLEEGDGWSVSGLCGRIWTLSRDYPRLDGPTSFAEWDEPGTVRVAFANWVADGEIFSEARVAAVDRSAAMRMRALWLVVGRFERLIGAEPLALAVRRAESA